MKEWVPHIGVGAFGTVHNSWFGRSRSFIVFCLFMQAPHPEKRYTRRHWSCSTNVTIIWQERSSALCSLTLLPTTGSSPRRQSNYPRDKWRPRWKSISRDSREQGRKTKKDGRRRWCRGYRAEWICTPWLAWSNLANRTNMIYRRMSRNKLIGQANWGKS